jgi:Holliday junction resolvase RusA-like endonuclease
VIRVYPVEPVPAPRQVRRDAWKPSAGVQRYRAYRDELRYRGVRVPVPFHHVLFVLPMPASWPKAKRAAHEGMPHQAKPDRDNLEKALLDAVFGEDSHVWDGRASKLWGTEPLLIISPEPIGIVLPFDLTPYYHAARRPDAAARGYAFAPPTPP